MLTDAQIVVHQGRITELQETPRLQADLRLDQTVILPGFINSHTHLEFSDLPRPIPAGGSFPEWIAAVVRRRRELAERLSIGELETLRHQTILSGINECRDVGTALVVDIVTQPWQPEWIEGRSSLRDSKLWNQPSVIALAEVLGLESQRLLQSSRWAAGLIDQIQQPVHGFRCLDVGVSPHATYSVLYPAIREVLTGLSNDRLMAMHVAESAEERQWCERGSGPFRDFFQSMGLPVSERRMQVSEAIEMLAVQGRSLLIHGNYLNEEELDLVSRSNIALVYCPRTHQHFAHRDYPLSEILERDIPLLLGTDSRASNPDLSMWRECKTALQNHRAWSASAAFDAITISAARFLGIADDFGSLDIGKLAWLNVIRAPNGATKENLIELLLSRAYDFHPQNFDTFRGEHSEKYFF